MSSYLQWLRTSWLPVVLLVLLAAHYFQWFDFRDLPVPQLPLALLGSAAALGIFFKSSRVGFAAALLLCGYLAIGVFDLVHGAALQQLCLALIAFNTAAISLTRDRSLLSGFGILVALAVAAQFGALTLLRDCCMPLLTGKLLVPADAGPLAQIGDLKEAYRAADLLMVGAILLGLLSWGLRPDQTGAGLLTCILLIAGGSMSGALPAALPLFAALVGVVLTLLAVRTAYDLAFRDELTGIPSRRAYSRYLLTLGRGFSIAVIDIDHFKKLNDRYGHQVGDQALRMVAGRIARYGGGRAFRYGGEEFVVVLRGRDRERAERLLERMREKIAGYPLRLRSGTRSKKGGPEARRRRGQGGGKAIKTTVSVGIATSNGKLKSPDQVLQAADKALYKAKRAGRNRVCIHH